MVARRRIVDMGARKKVMRWGVKGVGSWERSRGKVGAIYYSVVCLWVFCGCTERWVVRPLCEAPCGKHGYHSHTNPVEHGVVL